MQTVLSKLGPAGLVPLIATVADITREPLSGAREVSLHLESGAGGATFLTDDATLGKGESFGLVLVPLAACKALLDGAQPDEPAPAPEADPEVTPVPAAKVVKPTPAAPVVPAAPAKPVKAADPAPEAVPAPAPAPSVDAAS